MEPSYRVINLCIISIFIFSLLIVQKSEAKSSSGVVIENTTTSTFFNKSQPIILTVRLQNTTNNYIVFPSIALPGQYFLDIDVRNKDGKRVKYIYPRIKPDLSEHPIAELCPFCILEYRFNINEYYDLLFSKEIRVKTVIRKDINDYFDGHFKIHNKVDYEGLESSELILTINQ